MKAEASWVRGLVALACLAATAVVVHGTRTEIVPERQPFSEFPLAFDGYVGRPEGALTAEELAVLGASDTLVRTSFDAARHPIGVYMGYWSSQQQGDTIHSPANCLPGSGFEPLSQAVIPVADPRTPGGHFTANRVVVQKGLDKILVLYWFQSHGRLVGSEYWSRGYLVLDSLRLGRSDGGIVRLTIPVGRDGAAAESNAERQALAFVAVLVPQLSSYLPD